MCEHVQRISAPPTACATRIFWDSGHMLTQSFDPIVVAEDRQQQIGRLLRKRRLGVWKIRPMVRVRSPVVGMFVWESQAVVNRRHMNASGHTINLVDLDQPIIHPAVSVPYQVVEDDQAFELSLQLIVSDWKSRSRLAAADSPTNADCDK
jgi:hypothetical protein